MAKKALIIVDVQNDFCPGGSLAVSQGDEVIRPLNKMLLMVLPPSAYYTNWIVVASRDDHPSGTRHFEKWPPHCIRGTRGAEFHSALNLFRRSNNDCFIIDKGEHHEDGYSAFDGHVNGDQWDRSPYGLLTLLELLQKFEVKELYVGGLATDYCVKATVLDACRLGFKVYVLLDACRAVNINPGDEQKAIEEMKAAGAITTTTREVLGE